jgi:hypothetical protein
MTLEPTASGVDGSIARLLMIVFEAKLGETFGRLKSCRQCGWAFYDRSKKPLRQLVRDVDLREPKEEPREPPPEGHKSARWT